MKVIAALLLSFIVTPALACPAGLTGKFVCGNPVHTTRTIKKTGDLTYTSFTKFDDGVTFEEDIIADGKVRNRMDKTSKVTFGAYCPADDANSLITRQVYLTRDQKGVTDLKYTVAPKGLVLTGEVTVTQDSVVTGHTEIYEECTRL